MTGEEAAAALKAGVEALFAEARGGTLNERTAYVRIGKEQRAYVYVTFSNGYKKEQGEPHPGPFLEMPLPEMVERMVAAVTAEFPEHASQAALWRCEPVYERVERQPASRRLQTPAVPAHHSLYCRLVAIPPGARGNCCFCGVLHSEDEPHWLTEEAIENLQAQFLTAGKKLFRVQDTAGVMGKAYGSHGR